MVTVFQEETKPRGLYVLRAQRQEKMTMGSLCPTSCTFPCQLPFLSNSPIEDPQRRDQ